MKARNMTIAKRLGMGFGLVSVFLIVVIALGLVSKASEPMISITVRARS